MDKTHSIINVFLASPGDLSKERRLVKEIEDELNRGIADHLGFRVEVKGWEDTLSCAGRPQGTINEELDRCEVFIGMMWKKWGTAPSKNGKYTSGFEEEFERAHSKNKKKNTPEMAMYFKNVDDVSDPGKDLKKVLDFKDKLVKSKEVYYETFDQPHELQRRVREKITNYLIKLNKTEKIEIDESQLKKREEPSNEGNTNRPFSEESYSFLESFLEGNESKSITPENIARFRLLSNMLGTSVNDKPDLGVHDANILYTIKNNINFSPSEMASLMVCGLKNLDHENVPIWHWYKKYGNEISADPLVLESIIYSDSKVGYNAVHAMNLIGMPLIADSNKISREQIIEIWLSDESSENMKIAVLNYLKYHGIENDIKFIENEYDKADTKTSRLSLEALVSIQSRYNESKAFLLLINNQFDYFDDALLDSLLSSSTLSVENSLLIEGLSHNNWKIRLACFRKIHNIEILNKDVLENLKFDPNAVIRKTVLEKLLSLGHHFSDTEVKKILIRPKKSNGLGGILNYHQPQRDQEGEKIYEEYLFNEYLNHSESKLLKLSEAEFSIYEMAPYFALCTKFSKKYFSMLKKDINEQFKTKFERHIEHLTNIGISGEDLKKHTNLESFICKKLTREALDIICRKKDIKHLAFIRKHIMNKNIDSSFDEMEYLCKFGKWDDIEFIIEAKKDSISAKSVLLSLSENTTWNKIIAKALYSIGKDRIDELLNIDIPPLILNELIKVCPTTRFSGEVSDTTLFKLFNHTNDSVRKYSVLKSIQGFKKSKLVSLIDQYIESPDYRYYNVIFWLDFGISMPKINISNAISSNI